MCVLFFIKRTHFKNQDHYTASQALCETYSLYKSPVFYVYLKRIT